MDIVEVKEVYGNKSTVVGDIGCADILCNWSPDKIKKEVKRIITAISPGGYIFSSSNVMHGGVPIENALDYINTINEFGAYLINV